MGTSFYVSCLRNYKGSQNLKPPFESCQNLISPMKISHYILVPNPTKLQPTFSHCSSATSGSATSLCTSVQALVMCWRVISYGSMYLCIHVWKCTCCKHVSSHFLLSAWACLGIVAVTGHSIDGWRAGEGKYTILSIVNIGNSFGATPIAANHDRG